MSTQIICDQCRAVLDRGPIKLRLRATATGSDEYDFCSLECVASWADDEPKRVVRDRLRQGPPGTAIHG